MKISPARTAAFDILRRIETEHAYSSVLLPEYEAALEPLDRGLCHELVLGVLRRQIWLDRVLELLAGGKKMDLAVRIALRLGLYQVRFLERIPAHAAVSDSVNLIQRAKKTSAKGFVNAILRRAAAETSEPLAADDVDRAVLATSHPRWLIEHWTAQFGEDEAAKVAVANNRQGPVSFRVLDKETDILASVPEARASSDVPGCFLVDHTSPALRELQSANKIYFQDEASQMVARAVTVPLDGLFLDVCAAPGGKIGLIASNEPSAVAVAGDLHHSRAVFLKANLERQGCRNAMVVQYDATATLPFEDDFFDAVLVDAPCSGTGTIRRNPEIRYSLSPADLADLPEKQFAILSRAARAVKPGGLLVYSTCSFEIAENEGVAKRFLAAFEDFAPAAPAVPERFLTSAAQARTWPHRDEMDGFFVTAFRKRASKC